MCTCKYALVYARMSCTSAYMHIVRMHTKHSMYVCVYSTGCYALTCVRMHVGIPACMYVRYACTYVCKCVCYPSCPSPSFICSTSRGKVGEVEPVRFSFRVSVQYCLTLTSVPPHFIWPIGSLQFTRPFTLQYLYDMQMWDGFILRW
jgi:hypothetical protein